MINKKRAQILTLPCFIGRKRIPQICQLYSRTSEREAERTSQIYNIGNSEQEIPISEESPIHTASGGEQWHQFNDEFGINDQLGPIQRQVWIAQMNIKIKQVETLIKTIDSQDPTRKLTKFKDGEIFERYERYVKAELTSIPLVANIFCTTKQVVFYIQ